MFNEAPSRKDYRGVQPASRPGYFTPRRKTQYSMDMCCMCPTARVQDGEEKVYLPVGSQSPIQSRSIHSYYPVVND